ncbi:MULTISPECIES: AI-2E family transporter [Niastella]|uniref:AI-2E family transporter n=1 Tax=Niastella soli TaxID=2821487 RepID=A0ABS3YP87_9BACT|nr:AI-2E family transporter [Niastella soli]MBO9199633.1 AI-2E family transporter [Niastella soli]
MKQQIPNNAIRQVLILATIIILGLVLFNQLKSLIPAFLGAYTLYVLLRKWMFVLEGRYKWKKSLSASLLMLLSFLIILLPIFLVVNMLTTKIAFAMQHSQEVLTSLKTYIEKLEGKYNINILTDTNLQKITTWTGETVPKILGGAFDTLTSIVIMYFILYFMLVEGRKMESNFYDWVPVKDENTLLLRRELNTMVYSNAIGIPLIAILQGIVGLIGYLILGVDEPWFWFVITCITSMLPILGAAIAYVPVGLLFFAGGHTTKGVIMLLYGFGVIGTVDNLFRFVILKRIGDVHPLITGFGVIIGVGLFGFIGLIFGPILISLFLVLIKIYANEFNIERRDQAGPKQL